MARLLLFIRQLLLATALLAGSAHATSPSIAGVLAGNSRYAFWMAVQHGIEQAGREAGRTVFVRAPQDDSDSNVQELAQLRMINNFVDKGIAGLVLAPMALINAPAPVVLPIPVVLVDRDSRQFASAALVATDNVEVGRQAARALAGRIPPGSRLALFRLDANVPTTRQRETGFAEEAQRLGFVISIDRYLGADVRRARQIIYDSLLRQPVKAIFTPNELTTQAAYLALPTLPAIQRPRLVGVDYRPEFQQALENGQIDALVVQDAYQMGYLATHLLLDRLAGKTIPKRVTVPARVLTTATLHQPEVLRFLQQYQPDNSNASGAKSQ